MADLTKCDAPECPGYARGVIHPSRTCGDATNPHRNQTHQDAFTRVGTAMASAGLRAGATQEFLEAMRTQLYAAIERIDLELHTLGTYTADAGDSDDLEDDDESEDDA